jgi:hypothetical protein
MLSRFWNWLLGDWSFLLGSEPLTVDADADANEAPKPYIPGFKVERSPSDLPGAIAITGRFFRWHSPARFWSGDDFWRVFVDGPWKWDAQQRFAGKGLNCGHFFSLNCDGASAEATHYGLAINSDHLQLLQVSMRVDPVLDLTSYDGIKTAFDAVVENPDFSTPFIAEELVEIDTGGTCLTDRIGHWAVKMGYEGILFLGARAIHGPGEKPWQGKAGMRGPKLWDYDFFWWYVDDFREQKTQLNLVVFRGRYLTAQISSFKIGKGTIVKNPYFGMSEQEIERRLATEHDYRAYDEEYQDHQSRFFFDGKIRYVRTSLRP